MAASMHGKADRQGQHLCDSVLAVVQVEFPDLERGEKSNWCTFSQPGQSICFYVRHHSGYISVWPHWEFTAAEALQAMAVGFGLEISSRRKVNNTWARRYPLPIAIRTDAHVASVVPILRSAVTSNVESPGKPGAALQRLAQEVPAPNRFAEGATRTITVNAYERNAAARLACIQHHGARCSVCGLDFAEQYGEIGCGFIHVHHLKPLSSLGGSYEVDPVNDLRPVCPNCHEMLHRREPPFSIEELQAMVQQRWEFALGQASVRSC